jgi:NAD(P)-dependent dehydrogenase (short-subunit alcohol dehydrogenase family)
MLRGAFGGDEALDRMVAIHPIRRIGIPDDVADAVAWLFSDQSSYYTGQSLILDGGLTAQRPTTQIRRSDDPDRQERGTPSLRKVKSHLT